MTTSALHRILHTAEDAETLTRTIIDARFFITGDLATPVRAETVLSVWPRGQQVALDPTTSTALDQDVPTQEILRFPAIATHNATGDYVQVDSYHIDTKAMRKLKEGDEVVLSFKASSSSAIQILAVINQWFKQ